MSNRRRRRLGAESPPPTPEPAFKPIRRPYPPVNVLNPEEEDRVHLLSLQVLEKIGLKFLSPRTWPFLESAGCRVDRETGITKFPADVVEHYLSLSPHSFTMKARNPDHDLHFGGDDIHFGSASSAPNVMDMDRGRRPVT